MKFSFVIPTYNSWRLLHQLLYDIYRNCSPVHEVIIMDNGKDQETTDGIEWWMMTQMLPIRYERNKENLGFLLSSNKGLKKATGDIVALISTDVRINKDVVQDVSLVLNQIQNYLVGGRLLGWDTGWNFGHSYLEGWFLCAKRDVWKDLDYFDEQYAPNDMEDVDLSMKAKSLGFDLFALNEDYLTHMGSQTLSYGEDRERLTKINKKKFEEKWITSSVLK